MIDTIRLMVDSDLFYVAKPEYFTPNFNISKLPFHQVSKDGFLECNQFLPPEHIRRSDFRRQIYFPRIKFKRIRVKNGYKSYLKIEFSIPKLLFGNNFEEVINSDLERVAELLCNRLLHMGIIIKEDTILNSQVVGVHFGKNIIIDKYADCQTLLYSISKAKITARLESAQTEYRNDGHLVRFRSNSYELCFYDKVKDLESAICKSKSRSAELDQDIQKSMIDRYKGVEILRMEFRINNMKKYDTLCEALRMPISRHLCDVYNVKLSKLICNYFWDIVIDGMKCVSLGDEQMKVVFEYLSQKQKWSESKIMSTIGAFWIALEFEFV